MEFGKAIVQKIKHFRLSDVQKIKTASYVNVYSDMSNYFAVWISFTFSIKWNSIMQ